VESGSRSLDERSEVGVPRVIGSPGVVPAASATRLDHQDSDRENGPLALGALVGLDEDGEREDTEERLDGQREAG